MEFSFLLGGFMASNEIKKRVDELRASLTYHSQRYYVDDSPEISDYEYDMMFAEPRKESEDVRLTNLKRLPIR